MENNHERLPQNVLLYRWEVCQRFGNEFINCWIDKEETRLTFDTAYQAWDELKAYLEELDEAVANGDMEETYPLTDFIIRPVPHE